MNEFKNNYLKRMLKIQEKSTNMDIQINEIKKKLTAKNEVNN